MEPDEGNVLGAEAYRGKDVPARRGIEAVDYLRVASLPHRPDEAGRRIGVTDARPSTIPRGCRYRKRHLNRELYLPNLTFRLLGRGDPHAQSRPAIAPVREDDALLWHVKR